MIKQEGYYDSANGTGKVKYYIRLPETTPRAIVQIVHGMCEFFERYDDLCLYLCDRGFIVCGNDHIGHGASVESDADFGFFAENDGDRVVVADVANLRDMMKKKYKMLPYVMLGHSFGSFVARAYAASNPNAIDALILSGTSGQKMPVKAGKLLCKVIRSLKGKRYRSRLIKSMAFAGYNKRFKVDHPTGCEWVTSDPYALKAYAEDKRCTFIFTVQAFYDMFSLISYIQSDKWYNDFPPSLPLFIMAGENDPVSKYTNGIFEMMKALKAKYVCDIEYRVYKGERHEVLTGLSKYEAFEDIYGWIDERLEDLVKIKTLSSGFEAL